MVYVADAVSSLVTKHALLKVCFEPAVDVLFLEN